MLAETDTVSIVTDSTPVVVLGKECRQFYNNELYSCYDYLLIIKH